MDRRMLQQGDLAGRPRWHGLMTFAGLFRPTQKPAWLRRTGFELE